MTFSIGQNFFNELLESGNKIAHNNDKKSLSVTYELQKRMATYWKNNDKPVLLKSKQHSGMTDLLGHSEPLGGSINWQRCGTDNAVGSCIHGCPDEYPFWGTTKENKIENEKDKKENFENINEVEEQPEIIENFTVEDVMGHKENFSGNTCMILWIVLIVVLVLGVGGYLLFTRNKNKLL